MSAQQRVRDRRTGKPGKATMTVAGRVRVLWVTGEVEWVAAADLAYEAEVDA